ncbi:hypothetical protein C8J56DRAFT_937891 [Mycena floridula]|nr:hypothetical protein C8J56DRAFT_937891 [Mycena floridula]
MGYLYSSFLRLCLCGFPLPLLCVVLGLAFALMSNSSSCLLSDAEIALVQLHGTGFVIPCALGYGIYLPLAVMSMYTLLRRGLSDSRARSILFAFLVLIFVITTVRFASSVKMQQLFVLLLFGPNKSRPSRDATVASYLQAAVLSLVSDGIIYFLSDLIVVWRAWAICNRRNVKLLLTACIAGSLAGITFGTVGNVQVLFGAVPNTSLASLAVFLPIMFTNLVATSAIAFEAWQSRASLLKDLYRASSTSKIEKILFIMIEAGVLYFVFWIVSIIFTLVPLIFWKYDGYFYQLMTFVMAAYPSVIVILVTRELAPCETAFQKSSSRNRSPDNSARLSNDTIIHIGPVENCDRV